MTALVLQNLATLPALALRLRMLLTRSARAIDALVSARAARQIPEWQMRKVQAKSIATLALSAQVYCGRKNRLNARRPQITIRAAATGSSRYRLPSEIAAP